VRKDAPVIRVDGVNAITGENVGHQQRRTAVATRQGTDL